MILSKLQTLMENNNISTYIITKSDPHLSEYSNKHYNSVSFISNFTGSNGTIVVTKHSAGLWTDARYQLQAQKQLNENFSLHIVGTPGVLDFLSYCAKNTPPNGTIAFDGKTLSAASVNNLIDLLNEDITIISNLDLISEIWKDRPQITRNKIIPYSTKYCGLDTKEKINIVKKEIAYNNCEMCLISSIDDIAWLFNIRCISNYNSFNFQAYATVSDEVCLFIDTIPEDSEAINNLKKDGINIKNYEDIFKYVTNLNIKSVCLSQANVNYYLYSLFSATIFHMPFEITTKIKAIKNNIEIENIKIANKKDSLSFIKLIKWLKDNVKKEQITEYDVNQKLFELRKENESFMGLSFERICGYKENATIIHYVTKCENAKQLEEHGFLLLDSGANYLEGTTDITRTISLGKLSEKLQQYYTRVLKGHISLAKLKFLYGSTGHYIDIIARCPLWEVGLDYKHGTGHGIGQFNNVHEAPQSISAKSIPISLEEGMLISNEPGIYFDGEFGIRLENSILVKKMEKTNFGQFMGFETLSLIPFDKEAIIAEMLNKEEVQWLNSYHQAVYEAHNKSLNEDEKKWLKIATSPI